MPSLVSVAAKATMSGTGVVETEKRTVFSPTTDSAAKMFSQPKRSMTSFVRRDRVGLKATTKLLLPPGGILTGVFG